MQKEDRIGYIEDAQFKAKNSPGFIEKKFSLVEHKTQTVKILPPHKVKPERKTNLSPSSYHVSEAFKKTQLPQPRFFISKTPLKNFIT